MCKMRPEIIAWLVACSFFWCSYSTLSADLGSEKLKSTGHSSDVRSRDQQVPEFMLKLYESVEADNKQLPVGNTVRSMAGKFSMFVYNAKVTFRRHKT